jgi:predicted anti-sigma-YlaC factor YlaD
VRLPLSLALLVAAPQPACLSSLATGAAADALAGSSTVYQSDDDPELVEAAIPFGLKTMESVLEQRPEHRGLLVALAAGFTSYSYGFVQMEAFALEEADEPRSEELLERSRRLYRRARAYGMRSLDLRIEDFETRLRADLAGTLAEMKDEDVPGLYWTAAAWALMASVDDLDPNNVADVPLVEGMVMRALELDPGFDQGSIYDFLIQLEAGKPGGDLALAERYFRRALEHNGGRRAGTYVAFAEVVCVQRQDGPAFVENLQRALAIDVDASPPDRLNNLIMQDRARLLLQRSGDLFIEDPFPDGESITRSNAASRSDVQGS